MSPGTQRGSGDESVPVTNSDAAGSGTTTGSATRRSPFPCLPSDKTAGPGPKDGCFLPRARGGGHSGWAERPRGFLDARTLPGASENEGKGKRTAPQSPETLEDSPVSVGGSPDWNLTGCRQQIRGIHLGPCGGSREPGCCVWGVTATRGFSHG